MKGENTCESCKWFDKDSGWAGCYDSYGYCVRFPPNYITSIPDVVGPVGEWPLVEKIQWCGEWTPVDAENMKAPTLLCRTEVRDRLMITSCQASRLMKKMEYVVVGKNDIRITELTLAKWIKENTHEQGQEAT